jgi:hypothetical protein
LIGSSIEYFDQPSDGDVQGIVSMMHQMSVGGVDNTNQAPSKKDAKSAAKEEEQATPPSCEIQDRQLRKHDDETKKMKKIIAVFTSNTQKQLNEQAEKHAIEIATMKTNEHGNTKPFSNQNHVNTASERSQSIRTFHRDDQII